MAENNFEKLFELVFFVFSVTSEYNRWYNAKISYK